MSKLEEIEERWRNWGNVLLRVKALPGHSAVGIGVAEGQVPDVVQFVYGADGDVRALLEEVERLTRLSESALKGEREHAAVGARWFEKYKTALKALIKIRDGGSGAHYADVAKAAIEETTGEAKP